jgi:hypothetical protein
MNIEALVNHLESEALLPLERSLREALVIYGRRLLVFAKVVIIAGTICIAILLTAAGHINAIAAQYSVLLIAGITLISAWRIYLSYRHLTNDLQMQLGLQSDYHRSVLRLLHQTSESLEDRLTDLGREVSQQVGERTVLLESYIEETKTLASLLERNNSEIVALRQEVQSERSYEALVQKSGEEQSALIPSIGSSPYAGISESPLVHYWGFFRPTTESAALVAIDALRQRYKDAVKVLEDTGPSERLAKARLLSVVLSEYTRFWLLYPGLSQKGQEMLKQVIREATARR